MPFLVSAHLEFILRTNRHTTDYLLRGVIIEKNAENLLIIKSKKLAGVYLNNWQEHKKHSTLYQGK